uniref:Cytochrome P450 n=3 Tax=Aplanochytrium stocchinoi TaxID=215587 RepID=A0A7S3PQD5_9STRA
MTDEARASAPVPVAIPPVYRGAADTSSFASNALKFLSERRLQQGEVFGCRIVTWGVVFAASHAAVNEVLVDENDSFSAKAAYSLFTGLNLFGENVLFSDGEKHNRLRQLLLESDFAHTDRLVEKKYVHLIRMIVENFTEAMSLKVKVKSTNKLEINVYDTMKTLCGDLLAGIFLGFKIKEKNKGNVKGNCKCKGKSCNCIAVVEGTEHFQDLQSKFWRASTSSGIKLNVSFFGVSLKSAYAKGEVAKWQILDILKSIDKKRVSETEPTSISTTTLKAENSSPINSDSGSDSKAKLHEAQCRCPFVSMSESKSEGNLNASSEKMMGMTEEERLNHYLMFSSSLVAKSIASVITSFMLEIARRPEILDKLKREIRSNAENANNSYLDRVILEVERLYPPIIGCCRYSKKDVQIRGKSIPSGCNVWCSFLTSNRDPEHFSDPLAFRPDRWNNETVRKKVKYNDIMHM